MVSGALVERRRMALTSLHVGFRGLQHGATFILGRLHQSRGNAAALILLINHKYYFG